MQQNLVERWPLQLRLALFWYGTPFRESRHHRRMSHHRRPVILLFKNFREDEPVTVARHGADETRFARVVAKRSTDRPNRLTEGAVGDDDVVPHAVEDVATVHRFVPALDEKHQQIEITGDERLLEPLSNQGAATRREDEIAEAVYHHT